MKPTITLLIALTFLQTTATGQLAVSTEYASLAHETYWKHGVSMILQNEVRRSGPFLLSVLLVNTAFFDSGERPKLPTPTLPGFRREFRVDPFYVSDFMAWGSYRDWNQQDGWSYEAGIGITYAYVHEVERNDSYPPGVRTVAHRVYRPATNQIGISYAVGIGYSLRIIDGLSIHPRAQYWRTLDGSLERSPIAFQMRYTF